MASPKVDNRDGFGSKRSRNDGSQNDGDWTCPQCGNNNFGFRTVCNRSKCGASRPAVTSSLPITSPYNQPHPFYFGGVGAPAPMPHGITGRYGPPIALSGPQYNYGQPGSAHGPYGQPGSGHGPYGLLSPFPLGNFGGMGYGPGPAISGYGYGFQGSPWAAGGIPDSDTTASRKRRGGPDGLSEGDWICPKCDNVNYAFRTTCNIKKCGAPKPSPGPNQTSSGVPEGSWTCSKCGNLNYPFRTVCNRKGCGHDKANSG